MNLSEISIFIYLTVWLLFAVWFFAEELALSPFIQKLILFTMFFGLLTSLTASFASRGN